MAHARSLLLVEDDETTREVLTLLLEQDGWQVNPASSGEAAVSAVRRKVQPEVILCDLNLTGLQGAPLAERLRRCVPDARLLAMSASDPGRVPAGYDAMLRKPFGAEAVRSALQGLQSGSTPERVEEQSAPEDEPPILEMNTVLSLQRQMGTRAKEMYAFALADSEDRLRRMAELAATADPAAWRREAHTIKGAAGMVGALRLQKLASGAEKGSHEVPSVDAAKYLERMRLACAEIRLMLETLFPL